ncbi:MAG: two-component regulator propeller domain-containing protein [Candidatus Eisenbacteria bacterium]
MSARSFDMMSRRCRSAALRIFLLGVAGGLLASGAAYPAPASRSGTLSDPSPRAVFRHLTTRQGLSSDAITSLYQDDDGFLWICTVDGLNRYDGYSMKIYRHDPLDLLSIAGNYVNSVMQDGSGRLWISFGAGGADRLDLESGVFEHFHQAPDSTGLSHEGVTRIAIDPDGRPWFGTQGGLDRLVRSDPPRFAQRHDTGPVNDVLFDRRGTLWIASETRGVLRLDPGGDLRAIPVGRIVRARGLVLDADDRVWAVPADGGLILLHHDDPPRIFPDGKRTPPSAS